MNTEKHFTSCNETETENFAAKMAATLPSGTVVLLRGDLGAGKTVFARGFAKGLGITETVSSPTYTIAQEYLRPDGGRLYHLDLYRISDAAAALAFGVDEFLDDPTALTLIEWPERIESLLPDGALEIFIRHKSENIREFTLRNFTAVR